MTELEERPGITLAPFPVSVGWWWVNVQRTPCDSVPYIYKRNSTELPPLLYAPVFGLCKILKWNYLQSSMFISWSFLQRLFWWLKILKSMNGGARSMTCSRGPSYLDPKKLKVIMSGQPQGVVFIISDFSAGALGGLLAWRKELEHAPPPIHMHSRTLKYSNKHSALLTRLHCCLTEWIEANFKSL